MKLLIISDTHHSIDNAIDLITSTNPDYVLHLGDMCEDCVQLQKRFPSRIILSVMGNNDYPQRYPDIPYERVFTVDGKKIFMCHGHTYNVKFGTDRLVYKAESLKADIVLYGHTHSRHLEISGGMIIMNPGSTSSYGIIEINDGKADARLGIYEKS